MLGAKAQKSEIARLLAAIDAEYVAAQRGLFGLAEGTSQHQFITARMERIGQFHNELGGLVGPTVAMAMLADRLERHP